MSARQRRRLEAAAALATGAPAAGAGGDEAAPPPLQPQRRGARFSQLLAFESSDSESDAAAATSSDDDGGSKAEPTAPTASAPAPAAPAAAAAAKPPRRRAPAAATTAPAAPQPAGDDIDAALAALAVPDGAPTAGGDGSRESLLAQALLASERHLNADAEVTRLLGLGPDQRGGGAAAAPPGAAAVAGRAPPVRRKARYVTVTPDPSWVPPPTRAGGGFSMARVPSSVSLGSAFTLETSPEYDAVSAQYDAVAGSGDPSLLLELLARAPYHLDALLAMADYHRTMGQHEAAAGFLRRALFAVETAWHPGYRPWDAACAPCRMVRDATASSPDAAMWRVLVACMRNAGRAGAPRAAWEAAKLLLQAGGAGGGPGTDPARVLLCADYYAIRGGCPEAVVALTGGAEPLAVALARLRPPVAAGAPAPVAASPLPLPASPLVTLRSSDVPASTGLPNLAFSRALAVFHLELAALRGGRSTSTASPVAAAPPAASSSSGVAASADPLNSLPSQLYTDLSFVGYGTALRALVRALLLFPHALLPLLAAAGIAATDVGYGAAATAVAQAAAGTSGGDGGAAHPHVAPARECVWRRVFGSKLFGAPYAQYKRMKEGGELVSDDDEEEGEDGDGRRRSDAHPPLWCPALEKLVDVFVTRQAPLWRGRDVVGWLFTGAVAAIAAAQAAARTDTDGDSAVTATATAPPELLAAFGGNADMAAAEALTAQAILGELYFDGGGTSSHTTSSSSSSRSARAAREAIRHYAVTVVSDYSDELTTIAADVAAGGGADGGWAGQPPQQQRPPGIWVGGPPVDLDLAGSNLLAVFLQSLLPWRTLPGAPPTQDAPLWGNAAF